MLSRRQVSADDRYKISQKIKKNVNILEFYNYIWNQCEKCIQISTNMTSIGVGLVW